MKDKIRNTPNIRKLFILLSIFSLGLLFIAQTANAETYTATSFQQVGCPYGSQVTVMNLTSPGDNVKITGTGKWYFIKSFNINIINSITENKKNKININRRKNNHKNR